MLSVGTNPQTGSLFSNNWLLRRKIVLKKDYQNTVQE